MQLGRLQDLSSDKKKALLVGTYARLANKPQAEEQLDELEGLCFTYGLKAALKLPCTIREISPSTYLGKGKVEELKQIVQEEGYDLVVFDDEISPQQQRNLEKIFERIVVDRTELILGVFAQRAQTREARIQVELASCRYQLPRLRRLWTHLGRQRTGGSGGSGGGYLKGAGEQQIEIDRRIVRKRIDQLQKEINEVKKHRETQRRSREKKEIPTFAIVGYTNAGKSTLLKALTDADVLVEDRLFATLDTTTRRYTLPNKQQILLVDTVGFIRKIPHQLVAAFKSTLEEAVQADILLHLIDVSNPAAEAQAEATVNVLKELGAGKKPVITVLNKIDQCSDPMETRRMQIKYSKAVEISALKKIGFERLMQLMIQEISLLRRVVQLRVPQSHYDKVCHIMREGKILSCEYDENDILLEVEIPCHLEKKIIHFAVT